MKIGVLLSRFPFPLEKGDKLRAYHQIKELAKNNEIYLCCVSDKEVKPSDLMQLKPYCKEIKVIKLSKLTILKNLIKGLLFSKLPLQVAYFFKKSSKKPIVNFFKINRVDHIYCQLIRVSEYVKDVSDIPKTLDYMDVLSKGMERRIEKSKAYLKPFVRIEASRLKKYEHFIFNSFDHKTIISEQDRDLIIHAQNKSIEIIRNGVDLSFFSPRKTEKKFDLVFTGNMSYAPNVDGVTFLVEEVLPELWKKNHSITLVIAGASPNAKVQRLAQKNVTVTGWVDDIRDYYANSKLFIAPMQIGTGLQNKLLEAMAMQIPCITSTLANNALKATNGENIIIANSVEEYVKSIIELLENNMLASSIAKNGHDFVKHNYDWKSTTNQLEKLFLST
ncbi:MAG: sugar transferase (PEP-CTERM/EpsH1 system associated) [Vicingaceae bacterium]|jgi:sugar transferase (PEP-CTERM/EpsH1 system associated)